jgi:hypothetical protein
VNILPVIGEKAPCYFSFVAALKKPKPRGPAVGESAQAFSWRVLAAQPHGKSSMLSAACHFSLYSMGGSRYSVFAKLRYPFKHERSCLTEKSSLEIWAGHGAAWFT